MRNSSCQKISVCVSKVVLQFLTFNELHCTFNWILFVIFNFISIDIAYAWRCLDFL